MTPRRVHFPNCISPCGPVTDYQLREFTNGTLHVYRFCKTCGTRATSPVKRTSIPLAKWQELLIASGHLSEAWCNRDASLYPIEKKRFYAAAQREYGESESWDAETWNQVTADLQNSEEWVKSIGKSPF